MILIYFIAIVVIIEILVFAIYVWLKKDFKWIISDKDSHPNFTKDQILKYNNDVFNKDLGWDNNKKSKRDKLSAGKYIDYNFDNNGSRITKNKFILSDTVLFGDSYCMSRYSNDNDTIQFFLEKIIKKKIPNYGVGNYGLDQVFIKIKLTTLKKIKKVVIIFVPETILRIQSYWKHFLEFGNTFGFKPKFILKDNKLILEKEHIKKIKKQELKKTIDKLKDHDYFYENKFKKYSFAFPFIFSFSKNFKENIKIFFLFNLIQIEQK